MTEIEDSASPDAKFRDMLTAMVPEARRVRRSLVAIDEKQASASAF